MPPPEGNLPMSNVYLSYFPLAYSTSFVSPPCILSDGEKTQSLLIYTKWSSQIVWVNVIT